MSTSSQYTTKEYDNLLPRIGQTNIAVIFNDHDHRIRVVLSTIYVTCLPRLQTSNLSHDTFFVLLDRSDLVNSGGTSYDGF